MRDDTRSPRLAHAVTSTLTLPPLGRFHDTCDTFGKKSYNTIKDTPIDMISVRSTAFFPLRCHKPQQSLAH